MSDDGVPDQFVSDLVNGLCKDIFVWRMARSMVESKDPSKRKSAITRMRNAEESIRHLALGVVEAEYGRKS